MTTGGDDASPRQVHVSELLAAHGRAVVPSGRRRRRVEPAEVTAELPAVSGEPAVAEQPIQVVERPGSSWSTDGSTVHAPAIQAAEESLGGAVPVEDVAVADVAGGPHVPEAHRHAEATADVATAAAPAVDTAPAPTAAATTEDVPLEDPALERRDDTGQVGVADRPADVATDDVRTPDTAAPDTAPRSPAREWAVVGAQLVGALVGGAALWFGFRFLWQTQPVIALVLALVVTIGLVVVVRVLRKAEDLFSTVLAVLAGLIVTVSPPVLTLTGS